MSELSRKVDIRMSLFWETMLAAQEPQYHLITAVLHLKGMCSIWNRAFELLLSLQTEAREIHH
jgi:hypothetical protein